MRWLAVGLVALAVSGCGSGVQSNSEEPAQPPPIAFDGALVHDAAARRAHGERLTWVLGCRGCHGNDLQGKRFYELYASNLTRDVPKYTDAQLTRLMREGVHPSGRDLWAMPSELFQHLSATDEAAVIAYLRSLEPAGAPTGPPLPFEEETRKLVAEGKIKPAAAFVQETRDVGPVDLGPTHALGRYITRVTCAECHGPKLDGSQGDNPDLIIVGAYTRNEFERLITEGIPTGGRTLKPLMVRVA